jgi:hypothetical protein
MMVSGESPLFVFEESVFPATEYGKSNSVCHSGYSVMVVSEMGRPTPQKVGLFEFLRSIFWGVLALATSQTLPRTKSLRNSARILLGDFFALN